MPEEKTLKSNRPVNLDIEDLFNTKPKADTIKDFIKKFPSTLQGNRMLVLYGEWGSGKTTIFDYLKTKLSGDFETVFFEAWKHEKDGNLPLSLFDMICDKIDDNKKLESVINSGYKVLKAFAKSTKFNLGVVSIDSKDLLDEIEKEDIKSAISLYKENKKFEENFLKIEKSILKNKYKKLIVFVDDLDRCEPENVLDLLSAIKLFFSYGQDTIYFCAVDKEAVNQAVRAKYGDVIKSDEYLEKIFDISFNMPKGLVVGDLLDYYFDDRTLTDEISLFLYAIEFTNPRHLKKILNKYLIIKYIKTQELEGHYLIPELTVDGGKWFYTIFILYFIILYEFYPDKFLEIEEYENKIKNYIRSHHKYRVDMRPSTSGKEMPMEDTTKTINNSVKIEPINLTFNRIASGFQQSNNTYDLKFISIFTPNPPEHLILKGGNFDIYDYIRQFNDPTNNILVDFSKYIRERIDTIMKLNSEYNFWDLFEMCKTVL